jgi:hypothetical protein
MIYAFIRGYVGGFGRMLLDFYLANSFVINAFVLIYGACVYLAHISYLRAYRFILESLGVKLDTNAKGKGKKISKPLDFNRIDWDQTRRTYFFPLVSEPKSIWFRIKTNTTLRTLFNEENIKQMLKR